jgi:histidyl-tRNA synthetase
MNKNLAKNKKSAAGESKIDYKKLDRAAATAYYYGFTPIKTPIIKKEDISKARKIEDETGDSHHNFGSYSDCPICVSTEEKVALLRTCEEENLLSPSQPTFVYYEGNIRREGEKAKTPKSHKVFHLEVIGTPKSVAEAILIKTAQEIIRDEGYEDLYVDVNSAGDKESIANFTREMQNFNKKHAGDLQASCKHELRKNLLHILMCDKKECMDLCEQAPKTVTSLSEQSRLMLKEVLEYIESMNIPFKIDDRLICNRRLANHTIFKIVSLNKDNQPEETVAMGFRYNGLAKKVEMGKDMPVVGITIVMKSKSGSKKGSVQPKKPKLYFIQLGFEAKIKSLNVIEELRKAKIAVYQSLSRDKLSSQIQTAENMKIPVAIIMGQREAINDSVIVRDMNTRFQESVEISKLSDYLKKFKLS